MKKRFQYWFDNQMAKGTSTMIGMLAAATLLIVVTLGGLVEALGLQGEGGFSAAVWDSLVYTVNAWMLATEDGEPGYIVLMAVGAVVGLFLTSVLIGIVSDAVEEKLTALRKGNSVVLEKGHTVVLGFIPGEYELIIQLILAAEGRKTCLVIAGDMERDEMEELIRENVEIPSNMKMICRKVDVCDPNALGVCALETCKNIVVAPMEDGRTLKTMLAVAAVLNDEEKEKIRIVAAVSKDEFMLPANVAGKNGILMLQTHDVAARVIAHACTQPGLSEIFTDLFNFEGSELYLRELPGTGGKQFAQVMAGTDKGVPLGICHNGVITVNPGMNTVIEEGDTILLYAENESGTYWKEEGDSSDLLPVQAPEELPEGTVLVLGCNEVLDTILQELPPSITKVIVAGTEVTQEQEAQMYAERCPGRKVSIIAGDLFRANTLDELVKKVRYVVMLSDHELDEEAADIKSIQLLLKLRDIRDRLNLTYTITVEMRREGNRNLVAADDPTDFIVASNISSMVLAQLVANPMLYGVFQELLSNVGNELYLKSPETLGCEGDKTVAEMRLEALSRGYLLLGYLKNDRRARSICLNPPIQEQVTLQGEDKLIVIGEQ